VKEEKKLVGALTVTRTLPDPDEPDHFPSVVDLQYIDHGDESESCDQWARFSRPATKGLFQS
jgi:hypothetical protein